MMAWVMKRGLHGAKVWTCIRDEPPQNHGAPSTLMAPAPRGAFDAAESALAVARARARQQYWIEERDHACAVAADQSAANAQRFIDEYEVFIAMIENAESAGP